MTMFQQKGAPRSSRLRLDGVAELQVATPRMWIWRAVIVIGWALIATSLALFAFDLLHWLQDGTWHSVSLAKLVPVPIEQVESQNQWSSLETLIGVGRWCGRLPAAVMLFCGGLICSWRANDRYVHAERTAAGPR